MVVRVLNDTNAPGGPVTVSTTDSKKISFAGGYAGTSVSIPSKARGEFIYSSTFGGQWDGFAFPATPAGLPVGGAAGQVLSKNSATDYDALWVAPPGMTVVQTGAASFNAVANTVVQCNGSSAQTVNLPTYPPNGTQVHILAQGGLAVAVSAGAAYIAGPAGNSSHSQTVPAAGVMQLICSGTTWYQIAWLPSVAPFFTTFSNAGIYAANWSDYNAAGGTWQVGGYALDALGWVILRGFAKKATAWVAGETILTLPVGVRIGANEMFVCTANDSVMGPFVARVDVLPNGVVQFDNATAPIYSTPGNMSYLSLAGIRFQQAG